MQKKIPMRQCVGCREMRQKKELVRVVKSPEGVISLDFRGKAPGRGAYLCPNSECLKKRSAPRRWNVPSTPGFRRKFWTNWSEPWRSSTMNETQRKALLLLGLARKARKLEIGEEPCGIACRSGKAKLLLIAHDAGDHTFRRARSYCRAGKPPYLCVPFTKDELGDALGCNACALCAILDAPFAKAFLEDLPELAQQHEEILQELTRQTARVQKRRQEEKAHRKNVRFGKK